MAQSSGLSAPAAGLPPRGLAFGIALVGNSNYSVTAYPAYGATFRKNSVDYLTGEVLASYTWPKGWRLESGLGLGSVAAVTLDASDHFGRTATVFFGTVQVPLRLYRYLTFGPESRFSVGPHAGLQLVALSPGEKVSARTPIYADNPSYGSESKWYRAVQKYTLTYQVGASLNYVAPQLEVNFFGRYTNSFGNPVVARGRWEYDLQGVEQPALSTTTRLENVAVGLAVRRTFHSR